MAGEKKNYPTEINKKENKNLWFSNLESPVTSLAATNAFRA